MTPLNSSLVALSEALRSEDVAEVPPMTSGAEPGTDTIAPGSLRFQQVYELLRDVARSQMAAEHARRSFRATDLAHEAWLRLGETTFANREEACAYVTVVIRHMLVDAARRRAALKRGADWKRVPLNEADADAARQRRDEELLDLDAAMTALARVDDTAAKVVELFYFGGMTNEQIGRAMKFTDRTARTLKARGLEWLRERLAPNGRA